MDLKRRLSLVVLIATIAFVSGHLTQTTLNKHSTLALAKGEAKPVDIVLVAAGPTRAMDNPTIAPKALPNLMFADASNTGAADSIFDLPSDPVISADLGEGMSSVKAADDACNISLELDAEPSAMVAVTLVAPCQVNKRVVLRHAGLAVTAKTSATGELSVTLPAFSSSAEVSVRFPDDRIVSATISIPEANQMRRFGVQWLGDDAFQLHAFENGANYGEKGDVSAADPQKPLAGQKQIGGYLAVLGDDQVDQPMLAEVYTYPAAPETNVKIVIEAAVTKATCGREILGETLADAAGDVSITDLSLAMPDCSAIDDILVLNNVDPDLKLAAAD